MKTIGDNACVSCYNLTYIVIGSSVTSIGSCAFMNCYKLVHVYNKSSLSISESANSSAYGYAGAYAKGVYKVETNYLTLNDDGFYLYHYYDNGWKYYVVNYIGNSTSIKMPTMNNTDILIDSFAFYKNTYIQSVDTNTAKWIGQSSFDGCTNLKTVSIGLAMREIGIRAFAACSKLDTLNYYGTINDWINITFGNAWNYNIKATYVKCSNGNYNI